LEFHYTQKLRGRREILQLGLNKKGLAETAANEDDVESSVQIPVIIYKNAIKKVPDDVQFRLKFVQICRMYPETDEVEAMIMSTVESDFADDHDAWIERAEYAADVGGDVFSILEEATDSVQSEEMYLAAIHFAKEAVDSEAFDSQKGVSFLDRLFEKASEASISSTEILLEHSRFLISTGNATSAVSLLRAAIHDDRDNDLSKDAQIWLELAQAVQVTSDAGYTTQQEPREVLEHAMKHIPIHDDRYVDIAVSLFRSLLFQPPKSSVEKTQKKIADLFERILVLSSGDETGHKFCIPELCFAYLQNSSMTGGICAARKTYERIITKSSALQVYGEDVGAWKTFFDACITIERLDNEPNQKKSLRRLLETAVNFFSKCKQMPIAQEYKRMIKY
jgi:U3 small nucleolar RNA-associated protein 6